MIGVIGLGTGGLMGLLLSYFINLCNMALFGHPVAFHIDPVLFWGCLAAGLGITLLAGWFPARRASGINVLEALHAE
jgi:ABC-type lipoprotein release transport system permease subunit